MLLGRFHHASGSRERPLRQKHFFMNWITPKIFLYIWLIRTSPDNLSMSSLIISISPYPRVLSDNQCLKRKNFANENIAVIRKYSWAERYRYDTSWSSHMYVCYSFPFPFQGRLWPDSYLASHSSRLFLPNIRIEHRVKQNHHIYGCFKWQSYGDVLMILLWLLYSTWDVIYFLWRVLLMPGDIKVRNDSNGLWRNNDGLLTGYTGTERDGQWKASFPWRLDRLGFVTCMWEPLTSRLLYTSREPMEKESTLVHGR